MLLCAQRGGRVTNVKANEGQFLKEEFEQWMDIFDSILWGSVSAQEKL